ncbi:MAG TPA: M28 family metallopeptidase [Gammaproteobacteria bacterium]|nr:M28 family metallopeptidase [Gammaproteobacteria bacterium]
MPRCLTATLVFLFTLPALAAQSGDGAALASITPTEIGAHIKVLASDAFGGRGPASPGEKKTIEYLRAQFKALGLKPGWHGHYFQPVPMTKITAQPADLVFSGGGTHTTLKYLHDQVILTEREQPTVTLKDVPVVFVGYGIDAPEFHWNDFAGSDVRGKVIVVLVNDPGYDDPKLFKGKHMTYYGRWTYKYEEAARRGAAAVLVVHRTGPAGYGWGVVQNSNSGTKFTLSEPDRNMQRAAIEGWISHDAAQQLFKQAGADFTQLARAADRPGFKAVPLDLKMSVTLHSRIGHITSHNVIATLPGRTHPDQAVIYSAHWDHLGTHPDLPGDGIFNGAVDDGSGSAALLTLARAFTLAKPQPARSVVFLATTSEEQGLLGAAYYVRHPAFPLGDTVADINMDIMNVYGRTRDITVIGYGRSQLEDELKIAAQAEGMRITPDPHPETGLYYRADHFEFAKRGVPALLTFSGYDYLNRPADWGQHTWSDYFAHRYHKPADEFDPHWDLSGEAQQLRALFRLGHGLADSEVWPAWYPDVPFGKLRKAQRAHAAH